MKRLSAGGGALQLRQHRTRRSRLDAIEYARAAVAAAADKQAADIVLLDVRELANFADFFVICTAESPPQFAAITNDAERTLRSMGLRRHHREGENDSGWVLIDFGDVILHVFTPDRRAHYDLESAWSAAPQAGAGALAVTRRSRRQGRGCTRAARRR